MANTPSTGANTGGTVVDGSTGATAPASANPSSASVPATPTPTPTTGTVAGNGGANEVANMGAPTNTTDLTLDDLEFRKDGELRAASRREIMDSLPRGADNVSYNEVTGESTVVATVEGKTVTFMVEGDLRPDTKGAERGTDSAIRAMDNAQKAKE